MTTETKTLAPPSQPTCTTLAAQAAGMLAVLTLVTGVAYPLVVTGVAQGRVSRAGERQPDREGRQGRGLAAHRAAVRGSEVLLESPLGDDARRAYNARGIDRLEPRPDERGAHEERQGADRRAPRRRSGATRRPSRSTSSRRRGAASIRTSRRPPPSTRSAGSRGARHSRGPRPRPRGQAHRRPRTSGSSASRASTSCSSTSSSTSRRAPERIHPRDPGHPVKRGEGEPRRWIAS